MTSQRSEFLREQREKRIDHPARLRQFQLWNEAMDSMASATNTMNKIIVWLKSPSESPEPDILTMLGSWAKAGEALKMLDGTTPVTFDEQTAKELDLFTVEQIDDELIAVDGAFMAAETFDGAAYQDAINRQLATRLEQWQKTMSQPAESFDEGAYEFEEVCTERDWLEYIRAAISVIQMSEDVDTRQPRLPEVEYQNLRKMLTRLDVLFRKALEYEKKHGRTFKDSTAPRSFWWRH